MSEYQYNGATTFIDTCLTTDNIPTPTLRRQQSSDKHFIEVSQPQTQAPKSNRLSTTIIKTEPKQSQSNLHNCPKHLIKLIIQCIGLHKHTALEIARGFVGCDPEVQEGIQGLVGILEMIRRGKIKSFSKQFLKLVFQNNSESNPRLKLLQNPLIGKVFEGKNPIVMGEAKEILREFALERLETQKDSYGDRSKADKREINEKYLQLFMEEMRAGRIKERISKEDKIRIFERN